MLTYADIDSAKKAVVFELDDVLFPRKDYLLQVYYLFANLLEYTETAPPAGDLTDFFKTAYTHHGEEGIFERAAEAFGIDHKYKEHFDSLHLAARLPLRLLLYKPMLEMMQALHQHGKRLFVLTEGNPTMQLNKLKHMEWDGLDKVINVYFHEELLKRQLDPLAFLLADNGLHVQDVLYIHAAGRPALAGTLGIDSINAERFWNP
ncbi:HAD family hydrolase [Parapedobacter koreensis]|uniref:Phosphoglycolate phosphatase, HAD superfamily n=1 Tax=Parapedobacter koreensis TaxID=332977 RepID=A0A1H7J8X3_9SPHI|nr:HAD family hydrolase [Parapedobacter koreensis]SEK70814.1 Phosphoglycolate phosphatase, HAD superfamily [Parapedobacter koreensis]